MFGEPPHWIAQFPYVSVGIGGRIAFASLCAFWVGDFLNSFVLAKMKIATKGRFLWMRTIGSTVIGELVDTALFCTIAFYGVIPPATIVDYTLTGYVYKTLVEVVMTPITYAVDGKQYVAIMVGSPGASGVVSRLPTASPRNRPDFTCGRAARMPANM